MGRRGGGGNLAGPPPLGESALPLCLSKEMEVGFPGKHLPHPGKRQLDLDWQPGGQAKEAEPAREVGEHKTKTFSFSLPRSDMSTFSCQSLPEELLC